MPEKKLKVRPKLLKDIADHGADIRFALLEIAAGSYKNKNELWDLLRKLRCAGHSINQLAQKAITEFGQV